MKRYKLLPLLIQSNFLRSSSIVFAGALIANFSNYLFNLVMGRLLTPEEYGEVAVIFSLTLIVGVPSTALITLMSKYISAYKAQNHFSLIRDLYNYVSQIGLFIGLALFAIFLLLTPLDISSMP